MHHTTLLAPDLIAEIIDSLSWIHQNQSLFQKHRGFDIKSIRGLVQSEA
jgi:hypothetical protein